MLQLWVSCRFNLGICYNTFFVYLAYYVCDTVKSPDFSGKFGSISSDLGQIHKILLICTLSSRFIVDSIQLPICYKTYYVNFAYYVCNTVKGDFTEKSGSKSSDMGQIYKILCNTYVSYRFNLFPNIFFYFACYVCKTLKSTDFVAMLKVS